MLGLCEKKISDLVNPTLNKCSLSLGERTDKPSAKEKICRAKNGQELA